MARGYEGQFGHLLNAPYVWIPLALIFFLGLFDFRRPRRIAHLDLLVLLSFGICSSSSTAARSASRCRSTTRRSSTCWRACSGSASAAARRAAAVAARDAGSAVAAIVLIALPAADQHRRLRRDRRRLRGRDRRRQDHPRRADLRRGRVPRRQPLRRHLRPGQLLRLRPVRARAAVERRLGRARRRARRGDLLRPGDGRSACSSSACACAAAGAGRELGILLAFAWVAYPYTTSRCSRTPTTRWSPRCWSGRWRCSRSRSPAARLLALAAMAEVRAAGAGAAVRGRRARPARRRRRSERRGPAKPARGPAPGDRCSSLALRRGDRAAARPPGDRPRAWRRSSTARSQPDRPHLPVQHLGPGRRDPVAADGRLRRHGLLAAALAFVPRRRTLPQVAALAAAVLIALQLSVDHWFYLYIPWFFGAIAIALLCLAPRDAAI